MRLKNGSVEFMFRVRISRSVLTMLTLDASGSEIDVATDVRPEVVKLAKVYALLAQDVVGGGHVEEKVGNEPAIDIASG